MGPTEITCFSAFDHPRPTIPHFITGYVINFQMLILCIGLMQGLENWHEQYKMPALQDLLMDN